MTSSVVLNHESLTFCEKALFGEVTALQKETTLNAPIKFTDVCPDLRSRAEAGLNKWLEVILALMVQFHHPTAP